MTTNKRINNPNHNPSVLIQNELFNPEAYLSKCAIHSNSIACD